MVSEKTVVLVEEWEEGEKEVEEEEVTSGAADGDDVVVLMSLIPSICMSYIRTGVTVHEAFNTCQVEKDVY